MSKVNIDPNNLQPNQEFGLWEGDRKTWNAVNRLLKPHGLVIRTKSNYIAWGDQQILTLEKQ